jgi:signal peptidase I
VSARDGGQGRGDGWLGWDREPERDGTDPATADPATGDPEGAGRTPGDQGVETTGPWLRHDAREVRTDAQASGERDGGSPWLAPETSVPDEPPSSREVEDTAVPPTMAGSQSVPRWTPRRPPPAAAAAPAAPGTETLPAAYTQPVRVTDTDPDGGDLEDAPTGPSHRRRRDRHAGDADEPVGGLAVLGAAVKEFAIVVGMALVLSFIVKTWLLQAFYIPSGSMEDTLRINDRVIVSKLTPGPFDLRRCDIIVFGDPGDWVEATVQQEHGTAMTLVRDAMMFVGLLPDDAENHLIKRVIGLPGDHVVCCDAGGRITINGQPVKEPYLKPGVAPSDQNFDITVPRGRVWVMGDNRSGSSDSRFHDAPSDDGSLGSVDERLIVGRAVALVWPLDHLTWLSNPSSTFRNVPAPASEGATPGGDPGGTKGSGGTGGGTGTEAPTTGGGTVDGGSGG